MDNASQPQYGLRPDGTPKGFGYFGPLKRPDGDISTEITVGVNLGGKEMEIPTLVPTLSQSELDHLLNGGDPTDSIVDKAVQFAISRMKEGKPVFANDGELYPTPASQDAAFEAGFNEARRK